jgi:Tol biopolymer transport system component
VSLGIGGFGNGLAHPAWSPDGTHIAFDALRGGQWDIFTVENDGGRLRNVTNSSASSSTPAWTPDGARIVYNSGIENNRSLYTMLPDGGDVHRLTNHPGRDEHPSWFGSSDLTRDVSAKGKNPFTWAWIKHAGARTGAP